MSNQGQVTKIDIATLKPHPRQQKNFGDLSEAELDELARDIKRRGLQQPIEVLIDGTIVTGHQRVRAAKKLGWTKIPALICSDLGDEYAIEEHLIRDNLSRKQLSKLAQARCYKRLKELWGQRPHLIENDEPPKDLRDQLGEIFGISGRHLHRYLRILDTPIEVQQAFERNEISIMKAVAVARLPAPQQAMISQRLRADECARDVVTEYLRQRTKDMANASTTYRKLIRVIDDAVLVLPERLDDLGRYDASPQNAELLGKAIGLLRKLQRWNRESYQRRQAESAAL